MRAFRALVASACVSVAAAGLAQSPASPVSSTRSASSERTTIEYYYRIRWGSVTEFKRLYERNHAPLLREMERLGFITGLRTEEPFTHMAGGVRWDLRVTITYRDAAAAIVPGGAFDQAFEAAKARLYPDQVAYEAEEARRFSMLDEHWDVIVTPVSPH